MEGHLMDIEPMTKQEATEILQMAIETLDEEISPHLVMIIWAIARRMDYKDSRRHKSGLTRKCKFAEKQEENFISDRPCKGKKITCNNPENPVDVWYESGCRPEKCRFFEE